MIHDFFNIKIKELESNRRFLLDLIDLFNKTEHAEIKELLLNKIKESEKLTVFCDITVETKSGPAINISTE